MKRTSLLWASVAVLALSQLATVVYPSFRSVHSFLMVSSLLAFLGWFLLNAQQIGRFFLRRSTKQWINTTIIIALVLGIVVMIEIISFAYNVRLDLTPEKRFSLSEQTRKILRSMPGPLVVTGFFRGGTEQRGQMLDTFRLYQQEKRDFGFEIVDLDHNPSRANQAGISNYGQALIEYRGRKTTIAYPAEELLTEGILKILSDKKRVLLFLSGHGEKKFDSQPDDKKGLSLLRSALEKENYELREIPLLGEGALDGASALIIAGPKKDLFDQELTAVEKYLAGGGSVLFLVDPIPLPNVTRFLERHKILIQLEVLVDQENRLFGGEELTALVPMYKVHPITEPLNIPALFSSARPVLVKEVKEKDERVSELAMSARESWSTPDLKTAYGSKPKFTSGRDRKGPIPVAAVASIGNQGKMVVFGDSDFASNLLVELSGNRDLFLNTVEWLAGERHLISIRPKKNPTSFSSLTLTRPQARGMIIALFLEGFAVIAAGIVVGVRKRKRM